MAVDPCCLVGLVYLVVFWVLRVVVFDVGCGFGFRLGDACVG